MVAKGSEVMSFGSRLKEKRTALKMSRATLGNCLGVTASAISNYENGISSPKADILYRVFDVLGCDANYLFQDEMASVNEQTLTIEEQKHIKKYRDLDDHGKEVLEVLAQKEIERMSRDKFAKIEPITETEPLWKYWTPVSAGEGAILDTMTDFDVVNVVSNIYTRRAAYLLTVRGESMSPRFHDNDVIMVEEADDIELGEIGIWNLNGRSFVKQKGHDRLISLNPEYRDVYMEEFDQCYCQGRVVGVLDPEWIVGEEK